MGEGPVRLFFGKISALFLSPCSNHTGFLVIPREKYSLPLVSLYLLFLPPGMFLPHRLPRSIAHLLQNLCSSGPFSEKLFRTTLHRKRIPSVSLPFSSFSQKLSSPDICCICLLILLSCSPTPKHVCESRCVVFSFTSQWQIEIPKDGHKELSCLRMWHWHFYVERYGGGPMLLPLESWQACDYCQKRCYVIS